MLQTFKKLIDTAKAYWGCLHLLKSRSTQVFSAHKHLLLLTWAYPPDVTGGVYRPASMVREAKKRGWNITVLSGPAPDHVTEAGRYLENYVSNIGTIVRLEKSKISPSHKLFCPTISGGFLNLIETIKQGKQVCLKNPPSVIVASGPPFHNFVAAWVLAKFCGVPYILDYRDEWTECPFDFVETGNTDTYFEKKCIENANAIIFTTQSHFLHQKKVFNIPDNKRVALIPNGWEAEDVPGEDTVNPLAPVNLRIAFVGHLGEHTLPGGVLHCLEKVFEKHPELSSCIRVAFVGSKSGSAIQQLNEFKYKESLEIVESVPKTIALKIMQDSDGIILINEPRLHRYRPGKLYDYISMKTPILVYGSGGEVENLVSMLGAGFVLSENNDQELYAALMGIKEYKKSLDNSSIDSWLEKHKRSMLAGSFIDLLESVEA
ncbi:hypothetical protein [Variovorax sp. HJSM1_2]|uniref:hypothetical protein n=1 Tax=Variovorax sp. HJSM1_2 TaxID=3366263 RepID=UPI003BBD8D86